MKRKTPGQIAFEAFFMDAQNVPAWKASMDRYEWEAAAAAVLADQWRSVDDPPEDQSQFVFVTSSHGREGRGYGAAQFNLMAIGRDYWMLPPATPQPPVDPYAELKKAHAEGKVIQWRSQHRLNMTEWEDTENPEWRSTLEYRIKPWELSRHLPGFRPLADGEEWHRQDFAEGMLPEGYRPLLLDEMPVEGDEVLFGSTWFPQSKRSLTIPASGSQGTCEQRTTRPLPPTKEELDIEAFYTWWTDYKLTAIDRAPNRETAYAAWQAARTTNTNHEKAK